MPVRKKAIKENEMESTCNNNKQKNNEKDQNSKRNAEPEERLGIGAAVRQSVRQHIICRCCLAKLEDENYYFSLDTVAGMDSCGCEDTLLDCLNGCTQIGASLAHLEFPFHICLDCCQALEACCEFIRCVQNADKILRSKLNEKQKTRSTLRKPNAETTQNQPKAIEQIKKEEQPKAIEQIKKEEQPKAIEQIKKEEQPKAIEQIKKEEQPKAIEQIKKEDELKVSPENEGMLDLDKEIEKILLDDNQNAIDEPLSEEETQSEECDSSVTPLRKRKPKKHLCQFCGRCFERNLHLLKHEYAIHSKEIDMEALKKQIVRRTAVKIKQLRQRKAVVNNFQDANNQKFNIKQEVDLEEPKPKPEPKIQTEMKFCCDFCAAYFANDFELQHHMCTHKSVILSAVPLTPTPPQTPPLTFVGAASPTVQEQQEPSPTRKRNTNTNAFTAAKVAKVAAIPLVPNIFVDTETLPNVAQQSSSTITISGDVSNGIPPFGVLQLQQPTMPAFTSPISSESNSIDDEFLNDFNLNFLDGIFDLI